MNFFEAELRELEFPIITAALNAGWAPIENKLWKKYKDHLTGGGYHSEQLVPIIEEAVSGASKLDLMKGYVENQAEEFLASLEEKEE